MASSRRALVGVMAAGVVLALGACGGSGSTTGSTSSGSTSASASASGSAAGSTSDSGGGSGGELTQMTIGYSPTANSAVMDLGVEKGIFKKHGLEIKRQPVTGGSDAVALLLNGQLQLASGALTGVPSAVANGFPVQIVSSWGADYRSPDGDQFAVIAPADSGITSFKDLQGKTVAVNSLKGIWELEVREAIRKAGGDPSDVNLVAVPFADQVAALKQGRVDAVSTLQPFIGQLRAAGYKEVGDPAATVLGPHSIGSIVFASKKYIDAHPDVMKRWTEAMAEAAAYANDHPDEVRATIVDTTGAPADAVAKLPLPWYANGVDRKSADVFSKLMVKYGVIKAAPAIDDIVWSQAPAASNLKTPPAGLNVSG